LRVSARADKRDAKAQRFSRHIPLPLFSRCLCAVMLPKREANDSRTPVKKKKKEKEKGKTSLKTPLKDKDKKDKGKEEKPEKSTKKEASGGG